METKDYFDDLNLVDQFIPLEQLEYSLSPYDPYLNNLNFKNERFDMLWKIESLNEFHTNQLLCTESNESNESNLSVNSSDNQVKLNKYPEPYAIMIVKAILSREDNVMQLKDIYNYFMTNYEIFTIDADSTKWKNSIRHNLSRHKYFIKTSVKNAQGHYWSIDPDYLVYFKQGIYDCKTLVKQAKLKRQSSLGITKIKRTKKSRSLKSDKENTTNYSTPQSSNLIQHQYSYYNDSAYMSNNETTDNSFSNYYLSNSINSSIY